MLYLFLLLIATVCAAPVVEERFEKNLTRPLTVEEFDGYVGLLNIFKEALPKSLMDTLNSLNVTEKGELVSFISNWFQDKITRPESRQELASIIKANLPTVYEKVENLNKTFYDKWNGLKPETQSMLVTWRDKALSTKGATTAESAAKQLEVVKDFAYAIQNLDSATKEDLRQQFPQAVKLTEGFGFTVITTIAMILQKIAESLSPIPQKITVGGQECMLPLD